jgi:xylan 1,4-beta-xylosidase
MSTITNPILSGFNPDPSLLRVGDDYYVATSTFEWFPGVQIHHSRDLVNWRVAARPLDRVSLLDLRGCADSGGVWAPCLTYADGLFWLVYTDVERWTWPVFETNNYLTTAPSIHGPWSEPVFLNRSGFDPSLFHDSDRRKWVVNMLQGFGHGRGPFNGIVLQEYDSAARRLIGERKHIFGGSSLGVTEGPHLYRKNGYYYLMTAEGGTGFTHAITLARSRNIDGPYEIDPGFPTLTSSGDPAHPLQKSGHGSLIEAADGSWWIAHLCSRPMAPSYQCPLGRETALQRVVWTDDGWLRLAHGGRLPAVELPGPALPAHPWPVESGADDFAGPSLHPAWQSLRIPATPAWCSLSERPGHLRLRGQESWKSLHRQSVLGRRLQAFNAQAEVTVEFAPASFQHFAGLSAWYNTENLIYLAVTFEPKPGRCLKIMRMRANSFTDVLAHPVPVSATGPIQLRLEFNNGSILFSAAWAGQAWRRIGPDFPQWELADDFGGLFFTGTFITLGAHDLDGHAPPADFSSFRYDPKM